MLKIRQQSSQYCTMYKYNTNNTESSVHTDIWSATLSQSNDILCMERIKNKILPVVFFSPVQGLPGGLALHRVQKNWMNSSKHPLAASKAGP